MDRLAVVRNASSRMIVVWYDIILYQPGTLPHVLPGIGINLVVER